MAAVTNKKSKFPSKAALKRGLDAVKESCGTAASIIHAPDGTIQFVPCSHPTDITSPKATSEYKL